MVFTFVNDNYDLIVISTKKHFFYNNFDKSLIDHFENFSLLLMGR